MSTFPSAPALRPPATVAQRPTVSQRLAVVTVAYAFVVTMVATTLPSPLYELYRHQFGFSELMVTVIFAIYGFGVVAALLLFGRLSDEIGRRAVLLGGLVLAAAGMTAFLFADGVPLLLVARFLSGLAAGLLSGAATAALIDLTPPARRARATLVSTIAQMGGLGVGPLLAGVVATWIAAPLRTPFWIVLVLLMIAILGVWAMPEADHGPRRLALRPQSLRVSARARPAFVRGAPATFAGFAVLGLFAALSPALLAAQLAHPTPALIGAVVAAVFFASTVGELFMARVPGPSGLVIGYLALIAGMGFLALSLATSSSTLLVIGGLVAGFGQGLGFRAGLVGVVETTAPQQRAEVSSAFFVVAYVGLSVSVIGVGILTAITNLTTAGLVFTGLVATIAAAGMTLMAPQAREAVRLENNSPQEQR
jgi:predicted MFS family arabinose efflux permease